MQLSPSTVALITGGGSGLGGATARRLVADGVTVVIVDLEGSTAPALVEELNGQRAGSAVFVAAEFSLTALERSTVEANARDGDRRDHLVRRAHRTLSFQLSGAQVGISITTLATGYLAEPVVGGLVLGVIEVMATTYIPGQFGGSAWKDVWAFVILILVLVFRPQGLLGARVVDRA